MSCNAEEASCMEVVGSGTLVLAEHSRNRTRFVRKAGTACRISPIRYRQFQLPIVIYEAIQLLTACGAFCYRSSSHGPALRYPSGSQLYIPVLSSIFLEDTAPVTDTNESVDLLIFQTAMELCFICPHI